MRALAALLLLALAAAARAEQGRPPERPETLGEGPVAPAGSQAAPLHPDDALSHWRFDLGTGVAGRLGGQSSTAGHENHRVLLYFGGQADGLWTEGHGQAARLRLRMLAGGDSDLYVPSDGELEAAYMVGRRELRFVLGRAEVGRYPALAVETLAQFGTLPCFEGSLSLAADTMRLYYFVSPVEGVWVYYAGAAHVRHVPGWTAESDRPKAGSAGRLRYTVLPAPAVLVSVQADLVKAWTQADLLLALEGSVGYELREQAAAFHLAVRWDHYTRRGLVPHTEQSESELLVMATASLAF